tara:strand:+ start:221 stop:1012 length:792 start_codon:yes stop_codon:yes gene_type:complete
VGKNKDKSLGKKVHNRDIEIIDNLVYHYINGSEGEKYRAQRDILGYFDSYLEKYASLLHGVQVDLKNYDTRLFLSLFLTGQEKTPTSFRQQCRKINDTLSSFERSDLKSEVILVFLGVLSKYRIYEGVNALNPLTKIFRWRMKDWYNRVVRDALFHTKESPSPRGSAEGASFTVEQWIDTFRSDTVNFDIGLESMSLSWVNSPQKAIYQSLTRYDRYLLYLIYGQESSVSQVATQLGRDKDTIKRHIKSVLQKLEQAHINGIR